MRFEHRFDEDSVDAGSVRRTTALIDQVVDLRRQIAALEAAETRALAELGDIAAERILALPRAQHAAELPLRDVAARLGARLRQTDRTVQIHIGAAMSTLRQFPAVVDAWARGEISRAHVRVITDAGARIDDPTSRGRYEAEVLAVAREESVNRTRPAAVRLAERYDPVSLAERHEVARAQRRVAVQSLEDGMARLVADLPAVLAHALMDRLTEMATVSQEPIETVLTATKVAERMASIAESAIETRVVARLHAVQTAVRCTVPRDVSGAAIDDSAGDARGDAPGDARASEVLGRPGIIVGIIDLYWLLPEHVADLGAPGPDTAGVSGSAGAAGAPGAPGATNGRAADSRQPGSDRGARRNERTLDERTLDQRRADLLAELLLTGVPAADELSLYAGIVANVQIAVPVTTLLDTTDTAGAHSAELNGQVPIDPATARALTAQAPGWDRVLTCPITGTVLEVDRYTPSEAQKRFLRARDVHCRFPGCSHPARRCDIDHAQEHAMGGPTRLCNLECLCRRHHVLKTETAWRVMHHPGGDLHWTDPDGRVYVDRPPPTVGFIPDHLLAAARRRVGLTEIGGPPAPF